MPTNMKILFVCTGNICRSPVAERLLEHYNLELGLGLEVSSAGTRALNGHPMHSESQRVLREAGVESVGFKSQMLTPSLATDCDLLLGMTREHRAFARQLAPARWKRMYALREIALADEINMQSSRRAVDPTNPSIDIRDPIGGSPAVFDEVAKEISISIHSLVGWIKKQTAQTTGRHHAAQ